MAKLADATDLKSVGVKSVPVQVRSRAPHLISRSGAVGSLPFLFFYFFMYNELKTSYAEVVLLCQILMVILRQDRRI